MRSFPIAPLLFAIASSLAAAEASTPVGEDRVYEKVADRELKLYVVRPEAWTPADRRPAIVFFHGGGWVNGKPTQFNDHSVYFASRGLICIQVEYRLVKNA